MELPSITETESKIKSLSLRIQNYDYVNSKNPYEDTTAMLREAEELAKPFEICEYTNIKLYKHLQKMFRDLIILEMAKLYKKIRNSTN